MAVVTELIDAGLQMKRQGNLRGAIEHFRQLHSTYPGNARIMFELAGTWERLRGAATSAATLPGIAGTVKRTGIAAQRYAKIVYTARRYLVRAGAN